MNVKPKLVLKLPKAIQDDSKVSNAQTLKPQKKRKQPEGDRSGYRAPEKPAPVKQEPQSCAPVKKKFKVLGPGSHKPSSSGFASSAGPETLKPRISVKFSASGKPCVSLGGAPSSVPSKKHAAPLAPPAVPRDTRKSAREAPRKFVGSEAEAKPKPVEAEQGKEPAKKKKKFKSLSQADGAPVPGIKVSLPKVSLQGGAVPEVSKALAQVQAAQGSAAPAGATSGLPANGVLHAPDIKQDPAEHQKQAGVPSQAVPPKPPRVLPSGPPEQLQVQRVIQRMQKKDPYKIFAEIPSDEMAPGYSKVITRPMAFSIMWQRFHKGEYMTWEELQADLNQMFRNAMTYNRPETVFHKQAAKMLQIGAKVLDAVRMGPKPVPKAKAAAPAPRPPRDGTQPLKQPMQELKLVPEQRVLRPQRRPKAAAPAKAVKQKAAAQYRPKGGVRAATAAALSAAETDAPRETYHSRATRVFGCHQWKGLALGATAEDVPFSSGRFLARPSTGALPSGEQYAASLERFAAGFKEPLLQKVLERKAQALKAPIAPPPHPVQQQQQQQQQMQKPPPMQATGARYVVPSSGGVPIAAPRPAWQTAPQYIQGASGAFPQHANIHAQLAASASHALPRAVPAQMQPRAASVPAQPNISLPLNIAGLFGQHQQPQAHVLAALQKQAEALMAQHQRNTIAAAAAAAQSRPSSASSAGQPVLTGQPMGQAGQGQVHARQGSAQAQQAVNQHIVQPNQTSQPQQISQQQLQQQMSLLAQQYWQVHPAPAAPEQQNRPP